ncbi:hypothetical protein [Pseudomonas mosselii]|uniref:hypothetical protein n=1 Tax=Pseudomonas mosselii TaxID=78327 RepID=UPI0021DB658B|nr:hypothetical protein [Pseudomonas mosselii]MCU9528061.1 hypothetical protein [Pseudomonas mosselii]MCU9535170.1 hypothetical protein [Pseudomonas mosselii]MCU9542689.1 hypothetical protein [Pseudomonas mosselii]MCU9546905.1 hypothetical protein [Pseudomonas mosselii]
MLGKVERYHPKSTKEKTMETSRTLLLTLIVIGVCGIVGTWSGIKETVKGLISVLRRD